MITSIILNVIGGLGIFLYGMDNMSIGMRKLVGPKLKKLLAVLTTNRVMSVLIGIFITALVQSSSASTVMTVGFVNASLLTLKQGLGIILGANIGTTLTGWILVLKVGDYGLPLIGISAIFFIILGKEKHKTIALTIMSFGFIFFGLNLMSNGLKPIKDLPEFTRLFQLFKADSYFGVLKACLVGAMVTGVVQSSAATIGITIALANQGLIDYPTSVALVLGENVGTTVTALLASLNTNSNAKRAALAHTLINVFGVLWVTTLFRPYLYILEKIMDPSLHIDRFIATSHTIFNIFNVLLLTPFIGPFSKFLLLIVKDKKEDKERVTKLNALMIKVPPVVVSQTKLEVLEMGNRIKEVFLALENIFNKGENIDKSLKLIEDAELSLDLYEKEISDINFCILSRELSMDMVDETRGNLITTDEYETISDYLDRIAQELNKLTEEDLELSEGNVNVLLTLNSMVSQFFNDIYSAFDKKNIQAFVSTIKQYDDIKFVYREAKTEHFSMEHGNIPSKLSTGYIDILHYYRRASDHIYNIIEHFAQI
ncbi:MAG: Na/Pi cotransporter family protein [Fusobacteriaceae bacterium]|nr:Na/Pi cotransporter family protein [Fusobacteriaceae bacterium]